MFKLNDKVSLITGAGSGIGESISRLFAKQGSKIALVDIDESRCNKIKLEIDKLGVDSKVIQGDVSNGEGCKKIVDQCEEYFGKIDILVNSAGVTPRYAPDNWSFEQKWDWVIDINLKGTVMMSKYVSEIMLSNGYGSILNLSSIIGLVGYAEGLSDGFNPYPHSKGGVVQFTKDMAVKFAKSNIRINALCPGFTYTSLTKTLTDDNTMREKLESLHPMGRLGEPQEIANAALFFVSDEASFITGACVPIDGGYTAQ